jgi:hypothetical protein
MGKQFRAIDESLVQFIGRQRLFFVATAPSEAEGHINLSPKGLDSFRVIDPTTVAYLDLTGSGVETIAHLRQNARITIMFCAFEGPPRILRLHGKGRPIEPSEPGFSELRQLFPHYDGVRSVIRVSLERVSDSCGFGVPRYEFARDRPQLEAWVDRKGPEGIARYQLDHNLTSIDGLPGLQKAQATIPPPSTREPR